MSDDRSTGADLRRSTAVTLKATGITLIGVLASIGVTIGFGIKADWWIRVTAGLAATLALGAIVKAASGSRRGPLTRLANWIIGAPDP